MKPLVIIPTYNERDNLPRVIANLRKYLAKICILIVDDASPDGTGQVADQLARSDPYLHILHRERKEGLGRAYQAGFAWALAAKDQFDPICTMDADLSHDPGDLTKLLAVAQTADIALGSRYVAGGRIIGWSWDRWLLSRLANIIARLSLRLSARDVTAGYKCYRRDLIEALPADGLVSAGYAFQVEMLAIAKSLGAKVVEVPITFRDRTVGRSKVSRHELVSSAKSLLTLVFRQRGLRQLVKFSLVGSINFVVDLGLTNLLVLIGHLSPGLAGYLGTAVALGTSFILNRQWTFRVREGELTTQAGRFLIINGIGALINAITYTLLLNLTTLWYNLAKLLAIGSSGLWNFFMTKYWVFSQRTSLGPK